MQMLTKFGRHQYICTRDLLVDVKPSKEDKIITNRAVSGIVVKKNKYKSAGSDLKWILLKT